MCNSKITLTTLIENALQALHQIQTPFWSPRSLGNGFSRPQITWKPLFRDPAHFEIAFFFGPQLTFQGPFQLSSASGPEHSKLAF